MECNPMSSSVDDNVATRRGDTLEFCKVWRRGRRRRREGRGGEREREGERRRMMMMIVVVDQDEASWQ